MPTPWWKTWQMQAEVDAVQGWLNQWNHHQSLSKQGQSRSCHSHLGTDHLHLQKIRRHVQRRRSHLLHEENLPKGRNAEVAAETPMNAVQTEVTTKVGVMRVRGTAETTVGEIEGRMKTGLDVNHLVKRNGRTLPRSPKQARRAAVMAGEAVDLVVAVTTPTAMRRSQKNQKSELRILL